MNPERIASCYQTVRDALVAQRNQSGYWEGELSTSALSTATAVMALEMVRRDRIRRIQEAGPPASGRAETSQTDLFHNSARSPLRAGDGTLGRLIEGGLRWLAEHQNPDGGWGDTTKSISNVSTTMLAHAAFHACGVRRSVAAFGAPGKSHTSLADESQSGDESPHSKAAEFAVYADVLEKSREYIDRAGGVEAVVRRYGKDKTFSIPILTHCALAGMVDWRDVQPLPFELACLPARFYKTVRLPVVSYALPALIAIGQVRHHYRKPWNPLVRLVRNLAKGPSLRVLERIQPSSGGFLEATPLTSFVTMSLAGMGLADHPVARKGVEFLVGSVRDDGSWPIDTNLATWVTTLSVNALGDDLPDEAREPIVRWLLDQQYKQVHPYTNADPGGWAWTDLPGGVPDADDTAGATLALLQLSQASGGRESPDGASDSRPAHAGRSPELDRALEVGVRWLLDLQNRDGGWPTFCRGWGKLPFDRSAPDLTAHVIRAMISEHRRILGIWQAPPGVRMRMTPQTAKRHYALAGGFGYLRSAQRPDGSWLPLWFGNQFAPNDENPTYGTARVLAAYRDADRLDSEPARRGLEWLRSTQNADGGWGGAAGIESSVEETALAVEILLCDPDSRSHALRGLNWLMDRVEDGSICEPSPIGFYFAKLWYFERLYPLIFTVAALKRAQRLFGDRTSLAATGGSAPSVRG